MNITFEQAKTIIKHLCRDFDVSMLFVNLRQKTKNDPSGEYCFNPKSNSHINLYGNIKISTVLHELAHHIHQFRFDSTYSLKHAHNITFHRICFEVRDTFNSLYGIDISDINGSAYHNEGYYKALDEWFSKRQMT